MYKMEVKREKNAFVLTVGGFFKEEEGAAFITDYNKHVASVNAGNTTLIVDSVELSTSKADMLPVLNNCMKLYQQSHFKKVVFVKPKSVVAAMQLKDVIEKADKSFLMVDTLQDAYNLC